ncbi:MAG: phosphate acyltransferase [Candidatus Neomarinimicrobiota bacterium]
MIRSYKEIYDSVSGYKPLRLAVVNPQRKYILHALEQAETKNWIKPLLFKNDNVEKALDDAIITIQNGQADLLMKGNIDTATLLKAVMNKHNGLWSNRYLSHVAVLESPNYNRLILTTDGGVNVALSNNLLDSIIENALQVARALNNIKPNIAMLALIEKVSENLPETILAYNTAERYKNDSRFTIEGPIALDVALSAAAAKAKIIESKIAGKTDIFIGPNITATNFISKMLLSIGNSKGGGVIIGAKIPIILLSRSDTMESKLNSIALGLSIYHNQFKTS